MTPRGTATTRGAGVNRRLKGSIASDQPMEVSRRMGTSAALRQSVRDDRWVLKAETSGRRIERERAKEYILAEMGSEGDRDGRQKVEVGAWGGIYISFSSSVLVVYKEREPWWGSRRRTLVYLRVHSLPSLTVPTDDRIRPDRETGAAGTRTIEINCRWGGRSVGFLWVGRRSDAIFGRVPSLAATWPTRSNSTCCAGLFQRACQRKVPSSSRIAPVTFGQQTVALAEKSNKTRRAQFCPAIVLPMPRVGEISGEKSSLRFS